MRTLQWMVRLLPTRSKLRSCSTRSSFTCICSDMSPISSRNSVPPSANSKRPTRVGQGAGECPFLVTEQLALEQIRGDRAAIDRHERMARAAGQLVDMARDHLLAGAGLAEDQHVGVEGRHLLDQPMNGAHGARGAARPEAVGARLRRVAVAHVLGLVEHRRQAALLDRELQVQPGEISAGLGDLRQSVAREIDHRQRLRQRPQARDQLRALLRDGLCPDDQRQPVVSTFGLTAELGQIVKTDRLEVQKLEQGL